PGMAIFLPTSVARRLRSASVSTADAAAIVARSRNRPSGVHPVLSAFRIMAFSSAKGRTIRRAARSATLTSAAHARRSRIGRLQRKHVRFVIAVEVSDDERPQILITRVEYLPGALASPRHEPLAVRAACDVGDAVAVEIGEYELRQLNRRADVEGIPCLRYVIPNEPFAV